jgi:hypothetical protein
MQGIGVGSLAMSHSHDMAGAPAEVECDAGLVCAQVVDVEHQLRAATQTGRQASRQAARQTDSQADGQPDRVRLHWQGPHVFDWVC